jgi:ankyrin repeat protein
VRLLLEYGEPRKENAMVAAREGHTECLRLLLAGGVVADSQLLGVAVDCSSVEAISLLIEAGAEIGVLGNTAVWVGTLACVEAMLKHGGNRHTMLIEAVKIGRSEVVRMVIRTGVGFGRRTAIGIAASRGDVNCLRELLVGANLELGSSLLAAVKNKATACVDMLVKAGASLSPAGVSPLAVAAQNAMPNRIVEILLAAGADANGNKAMRPLNAAAANGNLATAKMLLAHGATTKHDGDKRSALWVACCYGRTEIANVLIEGGDMDEIVDGNTLAMAAYDANAYTLVQTLAKNGASLDGILGGGWVDSVSGHTVLEICVGLGDIVLTTKQLHAGAWTERCAEFCVDDAMRRLISSANNSICAKNYHLFGPATRSAVTTLLLVSKRDCYAREIWEMIIGMIGRTFEGGKR